MMTGEVSGLLLSVMQSYSLIPQKQIYHACRTPAILRSPSACALFRFVKVDRFMLICYHQPAKGDVPSQ